MAGLRQHKLAAVDRPVKPAVQKADVRLCLVPAEAVWKRAESGAGPEPGQSALAPLQENAREDLRHRRDGDATSSSLRLPVDHARSLLMLLKQQIAELDTALPRSRRSGRC